LRIGRTLFIGMVAAVLLLMGLAAVDSGLETANAQDERVENLLSGICTPVASTHPDDTSPATIAEGVDPSSALVSIWFFAAAEGRWLGFSPTVPVELNDLQTVGRLDAIFFCTNADATVTMPGI
jgi:hypothetical protein